MRSSITYTSYVIRRTMLWIMIIVFLNFFLRIGNIGNGLDLYMGIFHMTLLSMPMIIVTSNMSYDGTLRSGPLLRYGRQKSFLSYMIVTVIMDLLITVVSSVFYILNFGCSGMDVLYVLVYFGQLIVFSTGLAFMYILVSRTFALCVFAVIIFMENILPILPIPFELYSPFFGNVLFHRDFHLTDVVLDLVRIVSMILIMSFISSRYMKRKDVLDD